MRLGIELTALEMERWTFSAFTAEVNVVQLFVRGVRMEAKVKAKQAATKAGWAMGLAAVLLAGCGGKSTMPVFPPQESFTSAATFSRMFDARSDQTCEAARRALLSQGYIIDTSRADLVEGNKNFQPDPERHLQMHIRVVCAPESADGKLSVGFVTALQDSYALRKASNSASVGVSALGSLSLPFSAGHDSMIKVGSETIQSERFYESFFDLMHRYLMVDLKDIPAAAPVSSKK